MRKSRNQERKADKRIRMTGKREKERAEEKWRVEETRLTEERLLAKERRLADEKMLADERRRAEERMLAEEKRLTDQRRGSGIYEENDAYYEAWLARHGRAANTVLLGLAILFMAAYWTPAIISRDFTAIAIPIVLAMGVLHWFQYDLNYVLLKEPLPARQGATPPAKLTPKLTVRPAKGAAVLFSALVLTAWSLACLIVNKELSSEGTRYLTVANLGVDYDNERIRNLSEEACQLECSREEWCLMYVHRRTLDSAGRPPCHLYTHTPEEKQRHAITLKGASLGLKEFVRGATLGENGKLYYLTETLLADRYCKGCLDVCVGYFSLATVGADLREIAEFYAKDGTGGPLLFRFEPETTTNLGPVEQIAPNPQQWYTRDSPAAGTEADRASLFLYKNGVVRPVYKLFQKELVKALCVSDPLNRPLKNARSVKSPPTDRLRDLYAVVKTCLQFFMDPISYQSYRYYSG